jgi:hypothetical protein
MATNAILAKMAVMISANTAEFNTALQRSQNQFASFTNNIQKLAGAVGVSFGAFQIFGVVKDAINSIKDFEHELSVVKAITGATGSEFKALRKSALDLGGSTKYTAQQVASLQVEYGRLGFTTEEILQATKATLDLATATGEDLAKSADVAGSTVRGFGLQASETQRVVDVMAESFNRSALGLDNFSESMKYVAPVAAAAGASVEETTALLGTLADSGIRGSMAGTSLRKIFTDIAKDGRPLQERLKELGDRGITMADAFDEVGRTAQTSLLILAKNTDKTNQLTEALKNSAGAGARAAEIMGDDLTGDLTRLSSAYDGLVQSAGSGTGVLREFAQSGTAVLNALNAQNGALGEYIAGWVKLALVVPRTVATVLKGLGEIFSGTAKLTEQQIQLISFQLNKLRDEAKLKGNQEDVKLYTKLLADLTSKYGLLRDKAIEFKEESTSANNAAAATSAGLIQQLEEQIEKLEAAKKASFSTGEIEVFNKKISELKIQLEALNIAFPGSAFRRGEGVSADRSQQLAAVTTPVVPTLVPEPEEFQPKFDALISAYQNSKQALEDWAATAQISAELYAASLVDLSGVVQSAISGIAQAFGSAISGTANFGDALLKVIGGVLVQLGEMLITAGLGVEAFKTSLKSLNGFVAIAAGAALIALGTTIGSRIKGLGSSTPGATSASTSSQNAGRVGTSIGDVQDVEVTGEIIVRGEDLFVVLSNFQKNKRFTSALNG